MLDFKVLSNQAWDQDIVNPEEADNLRSLCDGLTGARGRYYDPALTHCRIELRTLRPHPWHVLVWGVMLAVFLSPYWILSQHKAQEESVLYVVRA